MRSGIAYAGDDPRRGIHPRFGGRAATLLISVMMGIYLGLSTIAEIDPFYRNAEALSENGSYTSDGWRGADAVPPPVSVSPSPARNFRRPQSDYPEPVTTYIGDPPAADRGFAHVNADDGASDGRDCWDCSLDAPIAVEPEPDAISVPAGCADGDPACPSEYPGSAPTADF